MRKMPSKSTQYLIILLATVVLAIANIACRIEKLPTTPVPTPDTLPTAIANSANSVANMFAIRKLPTTDTANKMIMHGVLPTITNSDNCVLAMRRKICGNVCR